MKVSIVCLTYNHQNYIKNALDGFVNQKTNFDYEIIVHDDASTDDTASIIRSYEEKYPQIKPIYQKENIWQTRKVDSLSKTFIYPVIQGEYVIFCEGDDYFTDEYKLQKQVDFLDSNQDFSLCFHPVKVRYEDDLEKNEVFPMPEMRFNKNELSLEDLLQHNFIQTNSCMYRWRFHKDDPELLPNFILPSDYFLHLLHAQVGKIGFIDEVMAVYRKHKSGVWSQIGEEKWFLKYGLLHMNFYKNVEKTFKVDKFSERKSFALQVLIAAINHDRPRIIERMKRESPDAYTYARTILLATTKEKQQEK